MSGPTMVADTGSQTMAHLLVRLHEAFLHDDDLYDDLDAILCDGPTTWHPRHRRGREPHTGPALDHRIHHLARMLDQLVNIAGHRRPTPALHTATHRARHLNCQPSTGEFTADRGQLRRMALAALDLLELLHAHQTEPP
ncbi:hypothetical protein [Streptomyces phytohabitans]|uniref:hypothetical protein n=1 Tax=Streptomyces phytohabitans TaxID=1150371 RepID=UPI00345B8E6F